ncbi:hypothetical protein HDU67_009937, partial [Dinochytrium kinnereticum]
MDDQRLQLRNSYVDGAGRYSYDSRHNDGYKDGGAGRHYDADSRYNDDQRQYENDRYMDDGRQNENGRYNDDRREQYESDRYNDDRHQQYESGRYNDDRHQQYDESDRYRQEDRYGPPLTPPSTRGDARTPASAMTADGVPYEPFTSVAPLTKNASPMAGMTAKDVPSLPGAPERKQSVFGVAGRLGTTLSNSGWKSKVSSKYDSVYEGKLPSIKVLSVEVGNRNGNQAGGVADGVSFTLPPGSTNLNQITVRFNLKLNISCWNANAYNLKVESMDLETFLAVNQTAITRAGSPATLGSLTALVPPVQVDPNYKFNFLPKVGAGNRTAIQFLSRKNVTFLMNLMVEYTPDPKAGLLRDPAFAELLNVCGIIGRPRPAKINYVSTSRVAILQKLGYTPTLSDSININCPVSPEDISTLLTEQFLSGLSGRPSTSRAGILGGTTRGGALGSNPMNGVIGVGSPEEEEREESGVPTLSPAEAAAATVQRLNDLFAQRSNQPPQ